MISRTTLTNTTLSDKFYGVCYSRWGQQKLTVMTVSVQKSEWQALLKVWTDDWSDSDVIAVTHARADTDTRLQNTLSQGQNSLLK